LIKKKIRKTVVDKAEYFDQNAIRQKVHNFWFNHQIPTLNKIVVIVNKDENLPNFSKTSLILNILKKNGILHLLNEIISRVGVGNIWNQ